MNQFKPTKRESVQIAHFFLNLLFYHQILDDNGKGVNSPYSAHYFFWDIKPDNISSLDKDFRLKDLTRFLDAIAVAPISSNFNPSEEKREMLRKDSHEFDKLFHISNAFYFFEFSSQKAQKHLKELEYSASSRRRISSLANFIIPSFYKFQPHDATLVLDLEDINYQRLWHEICQNYGKFARIALRTDFGFNYEFKNTKREQ